MIIYIIICAFVISISICLVLIYIAHKSPVYDGPVECFMCNKGTCVGCPHNPTNMVVKSAYMIKRKHGKVIASCTLTFNDDLVILQTPLGGKEEWQIPNLIGCHKVYVEDFNNDEYTVKLTYEA